MWSNVISFSIAGIATVFALAPLKTPATPNNCGNRVTPTQVSSNSPFVEANPASRPNQVNSPRKLEITVQVSHPKDLKIKENDIIEEGQVIAARTLEKQRLSAQQEQLQLQIQQLKATKISPPIPPKTVPTITTLPPSSFIEQEAAIAQAQGGIDSISSEIDLKKQEIAYFTEIPNLDPLILEHETAKLSKLQEKHSAAVRDYQLAVAKLQSAKDYRAYQEYQASLTKAQRVEEFNRAQLQYQHQLAEYESRLTDKAFQISKFQAQLNQVSNQITSLSTVNAPYSGQVRKVKWLGQAPDGSLTAEITLTVSDGKRSTPQFSNLNSQSINCQSPTINSQLRERSGAGRTSTNSELRTKNSSLFG